eukprot:5706921-Prymnesium_polylepis.3
MHCTAKQQVHELWSLLRLRYTAVAEWPLPLCSDGSIRSLGWQPGILTPNFTHSKSFKPQGDQRLCHPPTWQAEYC